MKYSNEIKLFGDDQEKFEFEWEFLDLSKDKKCLTKSQILHKKKIQQTLIRFEKQIKALESNKK